MKLIYALSTLLPVFAVAENLGDGCSTYGAWACGGTAEAVNTKTQILICSYGGPRNPNGLTWILNNDCDGATPCCDHRAIEMGGILHCNAKPTQGPNQEKCGLP